MTRIQWIAIVLSLILKGVSTQDGPPPPIFDDPPGGMFGLPFDASSPGAEEGEPPTSTAESTANETTTSDVTETQVTTVGTITTTETITVATTVSSATEKSTLLDSNETETQNITITGFEPDSQAENTTIFVSGQETTRTTEPITSTESAANDTLMSGPELISNKTTAVAIPVESIPGVADLPEFPDLEMGEMITTSVNDSISEQNATEANKTVTDTGTDQKGELTGEGTISDLNITEPVPQNITSNETVISSVSSNISAVVDEMSLLETTPIVINQTSNETAAEPILSLEHSTSNEITISSAPMNVSDTKINSVALPDLEMIEAGMLEENVTTEANATAPNMTDQMTTLPESVNATSGRTTPHTPTEKPVPSLVIDPNIAIGIAPLIFEDATPIIEDNKTTVVKTTTPIIELTVTTTSMLNTTVQDLSTPTLTQSTTELTTETEATPSEPDVPDHPPPIFFKPSFRRKDTQTFRGLRPPAATPLITVSTTQPPPPPIIIPRRPVKQTFRPRVSFETRIEPKAITTTAAPWFPFKKPAAKIFHKTPSPADPRYMTVSELAQLALQHIDRARTPSKTGGLQVFFKPVAPVTTKHITTTLLMTSTESTANVLKFRVPDESKLTNAIPWLQGDRRGHVRSTETPKPSNQLFRVPEKSRSHNIWGNSGIWGQTQPKPTTTQQPEIRVRPIQPPPTVNTFKKTEPFWVKPNFPLEDVNTFSRTKPVWERSNVQPQAANTFSRTKPVWERSNVQPQAANTFSRTKPVWERSNIQPQATHTLTRPETDLERSNIQPQATNTFWRTKPVWERSSVQPQAANTISRTEPAWKRSNAQPPLLNTFSRNEALWTKPTVPKQPADRNVFSNQPTYNVFGRNKIPNLRAAEPTIKPLVKSNSLFELPGMQNLIPEKNRLPQRQPEVRSLWSEPHRLSVTDPNARTKVADISNLHSRLADKTPTKTKLFHPIKNLRTSQHDIRTFKTQPYHYFKPSMNIAFDNELDLFLRSNLGRASDKSIQQPRRPSQLRNRNRNTTPRTTTARPSPSTPATAYNRVDTAAPLSFQELLLRQLQGDASIFDMRRRGSKHHRDRSTTKQDSVININIDLPSPDSASVIQQADTTPASTPTSVATTTNRPTTQSTPEPVADEHPPPIFDSKVYKTFMPFPQDEPTTQSTTGNDTKNLIGTGELKPFDESTGIDHGTCKGCTFVNDRCLLPDPIHCNRYIECVRQIPAVRVFTRECALGSFFDRASFLCVDPKNADCPTDRCREPGLKAYVIHGHCKHYWVCGSRKGGGIFAQAECCPEGGGFKEGEGCIENPNCTESCDVSINQDKIVGSTCECSQGIPVLSGDTCSCREPTALEKLKTGAATCSPILNMTFDGGRIEDTSSTRQHVSTEHIAASDTGELIMTAKGRVILWRFSNLVFADIFAVQLRFKSTKAGPRYQTLISNCDPKSGNEPSFDISVDTKYHDVIFTVNTYKSPSKRIKIYYKSSQWSTVYLIYDGERIVAAVDGRVRNIFSGGRIETRPNPINIGSCGTKEGLKGLVDDVAFFEDCISENMYEIFLNVLE